MLFVDEGNCYLAKKDLLNALKNVSDDTLILISSGGNFYPVKEIEQDEAKDLIIKTSSKMY